MLSSHRRAFGALLVVTLLVNVAVADDASFIAAMRNLIFGSQQQNETQSPATQPHKALHPGHYSLQPQLSSVENAQLGYPQPPAVFNSYQPSQFVPSVGGSACQLPQQIGTGRYSIPRWYFNPNRMRCELFYWSGCCGNANNFETFQACQQVCEVDPCTQDRDQGVGALQLSRYFFNSKTKMCEQFVYFGSGGNRNNFAMLEECQKTCPESPNPCAYGNAPAVTQCAPGSVLTTTCNGNQFCHVGATPTTTVCCNKPANVDRCNQPLNIGVGNANLQRWYFNPLTQQCQSCIYKGLQGNENNFLTQQECQNACVVNPCARGFPYRNQGVTQQCSAANQAICPAGYYCHVGATAQTSVCCQALGGDPCGQPMDRGLGSSQLQRWYWNMAQQRCLPFNYCGQKGTQNNFLSQQDCERTCYEMDNPCALGTPQLGTDNRPLQCSLQSNACGPSFWCHIGAVPQTTVCCPGRVPEPQVCQQPMALGSGDASLPRWFYDQFQRKCVQFTYKGRYGNQNNFLTQQACEGACNVFVNPCNLPISMPPQSCSPTANTCGAGSWCHVGETPQTTICCPSEGDPCLLPQARGTGSGFLDRWYYDAQTGSCQPFTYTGVRGNQNNFLSRADCEQTCAPNPCAEGRPFMGVDGRAQTCSASANMNTCPSGYWCHIGAATPTTVCCPGASNNICNLPMSTGEGNANLERFYFDSLTKTCRSFSYGGLKGNQNNFLSLRACQLSCQPLDNPCIGQPATTAAGQILFCSATNKDTCPVNFWCHLGATPETTVCCPGATNPCSVPLAPGTGNSNLARWYYNADDRACVPFEYNGKRGNQNNFETQAECQRTCPVFENPCMGDVEKVDGKPRKCSPIKGDSCGRGHFCLAVEGDIVGESGYCCPSMGDPCNTYLNEGEGLKQLPRWYFNPRTQQCHPFTYRGKKGNENNFLTQRTCEERCQPIENACFGGEEPLRREGRILQCQHNSGCPHSHYCHQGVTPRASVCCKKRGDVCDQQLMAGIGDASLARFHYSQVDDRCVEFNYTGLGGNENNFLSRQECELACPGYKGYCPHGKPLVQKGKIQTCGISTICPRNYLCHVTRKETRSVCCSDPAHFCLMEKDPGPCDQKLVKYAYNRTMGICQRFEYGGCSGNLNNFDSLETCTEVCCDKGYY